MFRTLKDLFDSFAAPAVDPVATEHQLQLATAVLLVEVMRADPDIGDDERAAAMQALRDGVEDSAILEKLDFSAAGDGELFKRPGGERRQFVVCGCETHVCVLQTVLDLRARGNEVFVVEEGVSSRRASDKALALERMRQAGAQIVSREMVAFEWMECAGTELFKSISREFIR